MLKTVSAAIKAIGPEVKATKEASRPRPGSIEDYVTGKIRLCIPLHVKSVTKAYLATLRPVYSDTTQLNSTSS